MPTVGRDGQIEGPHNVCQGKTHIHIFGWDDNHQNHHKYVINGMANGKIMSATDVADQAIAVMIQGLGLM